MYEIELPNNGQIGSRTFVLYLEVDVSFWKLKYHTHFSKAAS